MIFLKRAVSFNGKSALLRLSNDLKATLLKTPELDYDKKEQLGKLSEYTPSENGCIFATFFSESRETRIFLSQGGISVSGIARINKSSTVWRPVSKNQKVAISYEDNPESVTMFFVPYK